MRASGLRRACLVLLGAGGMAHAADSAPQAGERARLFLLQYAQLTATSDVAALELYRDDARIDVSAWQGGREVGRGAAQGSAWKAQLHAGWFNGATRLEASSFHDATVTPQGARLVIRARRFSQTRCYWDDGYAVAIEPDRNGHDRIVQERLTFLRDAACPGAAAAAPGVRPPVPAAAADPVAAIPPAGLPPNVVPSGRGLPRLPAPMAAEPGRTGASGVGAVAGAAGATVR